MIEVKGIVTSKQGMSCAGFYAINNRTKHLRTGLYITVRDGRRLFTPEIPFFNMEEHFPYTSIRNYYVGNCNRGLAKSIGAEGEILFSFEGPGAERGAEITVAMLPEVNGILEKSFMDRWVFAQREFQQYAKYIAARYWTDRAVEHAYRPEDASIRTVG